MSNTIASIAGTENRGRAARPLIQLPRLRKLREDILAARYHVCTQKASLMTEYFLRHSRRGLWERLLSPLQFRLYRGSLEKSAGSVPQKPWQAVLNNKLNALLLRGRGLSQHDYLLLHARAFSHILDNMELKVYEGELIVGNPSAWRVGAPIHPDLGGLLMMPEVGNIAARAQNPMGIEPSQLEELERVIFPFWFNRSVLALTPLLSDDPGLFNTMLEGKYFILTQFSGISHVTPDYPSVLQYGFNGIAAGIRERLEKVRAEMETGGVNELRDKQAFYEAALICAEAAVDYGKRWSRHLEAEAGKAQDEARRSELLKLSEVFNRVPAESAQTLYEALQSVFITHVMLHYENFQHGISFGRMDQYLYPYYVRDIENGRLTRDEAGELLGCFIAKAGELLPLFFDRATEYFSGLSSASGITLGGEGVVNDLSYLILQAYDQVRLRQPNFHVRLAEDTPSEFIGLCCDVLKKGGGLPAFFNDGQVVGALAESGIEAADARDYSIVGCVEWGCPGRSFPAAGAVFVNLPMALQLALHNGRTEGGQFGPRTGTLESLTSMDEIVAAFRGQLKFLLQRAAAGNNAIERTHAAYRPTPFLSTIVEGCLDKGLEVNSGGAKYNSTGCQGVGLADVVDSLAAIDELVFKSGRVSLAGLVNAADNDFAGSAELLAHIRSRLQGYGENCESGNHFAGLVSGIYTEEAGKIANSRGGRYFPGFWSMTTHQGFGARMGALPSGRRAGMPLANGLSPCNGRDRQGPTAALSSAGHVANARIGNGYAFNQKLDLAILQKPGGNDLLSALVQGFFAGGGMQVQFNIVDPALLIEAKEHPDRYPSLVVRVSGYSAYFNDLTESMKDELIERTLHNFNSCSC